MLITIDAGHMAAVLSLDSDHLLEPYPQPFRLQPDLTLLIPYDEYLTFLRTTENIDGYLYRPAKEALLSPVRSYYMDMARAVAKECYYASRTAGQPTRIRHWFKGASGTCAIRSVDYSDGFNAYMEQRGFGFSTGYAPIRGEWEYASQLAGCSRKQVPTWNPVVEGGV